MIVLTAMIIVWLNLTLNCLNRVATLALIMIRNVWWGRRYNANSGEGVDLLLADPFVEREDPLLTRIRPVDVPDVWGMPILLNFAPYLHTTKRVKLTPKLYVVDVANLDIFKQLAKKIRRLVNLGRVR